MTEPTWTVTRSQLIDALANIEVRNVQEERQRQCKEDRMTTPNPYDDLYWFRCSPSVLKIMAEMELPGYRECHEVPRLIFGEEDGIHLHGVPMAVASTLTQVAGEEKPPAGRLAHCEVKGFRDLGIVRVSESTLAGEAMLRAESTDGAVAEFPASSLHFITWLPEGVKAPAALTMREPVSFGDYDDEDDPWLPEEVNRDA